MATKNQQQTLSKWFFLLGSAGLAVVFWQIIEPFILVLITASIAAIMLSPIERRVHAHIKSQKLSSFMMVAGVLVLIVLPLLLTAALMIDEARNIVDASVGDNGFLRTFDPASHPLFTKLPLSFQQDLADLNLEEFTRSIGEWTARNIGLIFSGTATAILNIFIFFISLYYILVDRQKIKQEVAALSPFNNALDEKIMERIVRTVRGVVFGALIVAAIQGLLAAIGMTIFGVPGALIWGALTIIAAQVPFVGAGLVLIPAITYLFLIGNLHGGVGLLIWSLIVVGLADNILAPWLLKGQTHMHSLLLLISVLGGLHAFGSIGIIIGPTILAAVMVVIELYKNGILEKGSVTIK